MCGSNTEPEKVLQQPQPGLLDRLQCKRCQPARSEGSLGMQRPELAMHRQPTRLAQPVGIYIYHRPDAAAADPWAHRYPLLHEAVVRRLLLFNQTRHQRHLPLNGGRRDQGGLLSWLKIKKSCASRKAAMPTQPVQFTPHRFVGLADRWLFYCCPSA